MMSAALTAMAPESTGPSCSIRIVAMPAGDGRLYMSTSSLARRTRQMLQGSTSVNSQNGISRDAVNQVCTLVHVAACQVG